jgi:hypothetical protein
LDENNRLENSERIYEAACFVLTNAPASTGFYHRTGSKRLLMRHRLLIENLVDPVAILGGKIDFVYTLLECL